MNPERIEKLKAEYTDQYAVVDERRPELARFEGLVGQVKTINLNGRALVEFNDTGNRGRYDVGLDYLKVVDKPEPKPAPDKKKPAAAEAKPAVEKPKERLSELELARMNKEADKTDAESVPPKPPEADRPQ